MSVQPQFEQPEWIDGLCNDDSSKRARAFQAMMDVWHQPVYRFTRTLLGQHEDAADATQETFIQVLRSIGSFRREAKFSTWVFTIARRKALDLLRQRKRIEHLNEELAFEAQLHTLQTDPLFDGDRALQRLHAAVLTLPERQKEVFTLRYFNEMPFGELAQILDLSEGSVKASYFHAKEKIMERVTID